MNLFLKKNKYPLGLNVSRVSFWQKLNECATSYRFWKIVFFLHCTSTLMRMKQVYDETPHPITSWKFSGQWFWILTSGVISRPILGWLYPNCIQVLGIKQPTVQHCSLYINECVFVLPSLFSALCRVSLLIAFFAKLFMAVRP